MSDFCCCLAHCLWLHFPAVQTVHCHAFIDRCSNHQQVSEGDYPRLNTNVCISSRVKVTGVIQHSSAVIAKLQRQSFLHVFGRYCREPVPSLSVTRAEVQERFSSAEFPCWQEMLGKRNRQLKIPFHSPWLVYEKKSLPRWCAIKLCSCSLSISFYCAGHIDWDWTVSGKNKGNLKQLWPTG